MCKGIKSGRDVVDGLSVAVGIDLSVYPNGFSIIIGVDGSLVIHGERVLIKSKILDVPEPPERADIND